MSDFSQYKIISGKLKKRFLLRKPNLNEVSEQFSALSRDLKEFKAYSGYCSLAVARCEHSMANTAAEVNALLDSARLLRDGNQLNGAISAYRHAIKIAEPSIVVSIYAELAHLYKFNNRFIEASNVFIEGQLFKEAIDCYLKCNEWEKALDCFSKISTERMKESDFVTLFLLKLYLNDSKSEFHLPVIECHSENDELMDLNIMLSSLLIWTQTKCEDKSHMSDALAVQLFPKLNGHQNQLLFLILTEKND